MPDCFVAPLVGILQPGLKEVQACSEAGQHQNRHQQVEGDEPVQEQPRHYCCQRERDGKGGGGKDRKWMRRRGGGRDITEERKERFWGRVDEQSYSVI